MKSEGQRARQLSFLNEWFKQPPTGKEIPGETPDRRDLSELQIDKQPQMTAYARWFWQLTAPWSPDLQDSAIDQLGLRTIAGLEKYRREAEIRISRIASGKDLADYLTPEELLYVCRYQEQQSKIRGLTHAVWNSSNWAEWRATASQIGSSQDGLIDKSNGFTVRIGNEDLVTSLEYEYTAQNLLEGHISESQSLYVWVNDRSWKQIPDTGADSNVRLSGVKVVGKSVIFEGRFYDRSTRGRKMQIEINDKGPQLLESRILKRLDLERDVIGAEDSDFWSLLGGCYNSELGYMALEAYIRPALAIDYQMASFDYLKPLE